MSNNFVLPIGYQFENYLIESVLGSGGFGITYLVKDISLDTKFAIKEYIPSDFAYRGDNYRVLPKTPNDTDNFEWGLRSFREEAKTLVRFIDSDNIVKVYRFFEANGTAYFVMEYIEGENFADLLKNEELSPTEIEEMFYGVINGLKRIHQGDVLHKDIKPANIMVRRNNPILIDFGSARENTPGKEHTRIITDRYSPIEQYDNSQEIGFWSDIYSLSATFYRAVIGEAPPESSGRVIEDKCLNLSRERPKGYSSKFLSYIDSGLQLLPKDRPQTIKQWENKRKSSSKKFERKFSFKIKNEPNKVFKLLRIGFILSSVVGFAALVNIISTSFNSVNDDSVVEPNTIFPLITDYTSRETPDGNNPRSIPRPIENNIVQSKEFKINNLNWEEINISKEFNLRNYKYLYLEAKYPFRIRSKSSTKYIRPILLKKGGKIKLSDIGKNVRYKKLEIKSAKENDDVKLNLSNN